MQKLPELSIFFPFWNEEANIASVVEKALEIAPTVADTYEIIIVDDGSADKTAERAGELVKKYKNVSLVKHAVNRGYGAALRSGLEHAKYKTIVFTDGDLQFDFSEITKFVEKIGDADIVIGYRTKRRDKNLFKRLLLMKMLKVWDFILFGFSVKDIDCGFKMFKKDAIEKIGPFHSEGAMITTEILAKATKKKLKITQVGVTHYPREHGEQTGANLFVIIRAVLESFSLFLDIKNKRF